MSYVFTVETVEPGNDRSLESWTNCPVRPAFRLSFDRTSLSRVPGV